MPQVLAVITLEKSKGKLTVEIVFGHAHVGNYRFFLWDSNGKNPEPLSHGNNVDKEVDIFEIDKNPESLDEMILSYELIIQAAEVKPMQIYSVTITVRQEGIVCDGGLIQEVGRFEDVRSCVGFRRFKTI